MSFPKREPIQLELDAALGEIHRVGRILPAITPHNGPAERVRLIAALERGEAADARFEVEPRRVPPVVWDRLREAASLAARWDGPATSLYLAKLEELELDLMMLESLGEPRRIRPLAARRFGTGRSMVAVGGADLPVATIAKRFLELPPVEPEPRTLPADAPPGVPSAASWMRRLAAAIGLSEVEVRVEPRLAAGAATGERLILLANRRFGVSEARRLAVHEVLGHLVAAANGRSQPLRLLEHGTAGSFADQEGLALYLEDQAGALDAYRLRTIAARVWVVDRMHGGATFPDTARALVRDLGFSPPDAVALCERSWRGGGVARDAGYLRGFLRVRDAVESGRTTVDALRSGRVGVADVSSFDALAHRGLYRAPVYRPTLARSLAATEGGTRRSTSPPSLAASLTMFEET